MLFPQGSRALKSPRTFALLWEDDLVVPAQPLPAAFGALVHQSLGGLLPWEGCRRWSG